MSGALLGLALALALGLSLTAYTDNTRFHTTTSRSPPWRKLCGVILALLRERREYESRTPVSYPSGARPEAEG